MITQRDKNIVNQNLYVDLQNNPCYIVGDNTQGNIGKTTNQARKQVFYLFRPIQGDTVTGSMEGTVTGSGRKTAAVNQSTPRRRPAEIMIKKRGRRCAEKMCITFNI
jgi:hypothetical protein